MIPTKFQEEYGNFGTVSGLNSFYQNTVSALSSVADLTSNPVNPQAIAGGYFSSDVQSSNYLYGKSGWKWFYNGDLEANNGTFRGDLVGATFKTQLALDGTANAAVTTTTTSLTDTRQTTLIPNYYVGRTISCNGKTMIITSNTFDTFTGASWSGGGTPGNGFAWFLTGSRLYITGNDIYLYDDTTGGYPVTGDAAIIYFPRTDDETQRFLIRKRAGVNNDNENVQEFFYEKAANSGQLNYIYIGRYGQDTINYDFTDVIINNVNKRWYLEHNSEKMQPLIATFSSDYGGFYDAGGAVIRIQCKETTSQSPYDPETDSGGAHVGIGILLKSTNGTTNGTTAFKLIDTTASFTSALVGYTVVNLSDIPMTSALVTACDSSTTLSISVDIFSSGENYSIGYGGYQLAVDNTNIWACATVLPSTANSWSIGSQTKYFNKIHTGDSIYGLENVLKSAGQAMSDRTPVYLCTGAAEYLAIDQSDYTISAYAAVQGWDLISNNDYQAGQSFTTTDTVNTITKCSWYGRREGAASGNILFSLYLADANDVPTGSALATKNIDPTTISDTTPDWYDVTWTTPVTVSKNTKYVFTMSYAGGTATKYILWIRKDSNVYSGGKYVYGTYAGTIWQYDSNKDFMFRIYENQGVANRVYKTTAGTVGKFETFLGFTTSAVVAEGDGVYVKVCGLLSGMSGLTGGSVYYLSDTEGAISTSPGSTSKKIGIASGTTSLIILNNI